MLTATLLDDGSAYNLTGATSRVLILKKQGTGVFMVNHQEVTVVSATAGTISYAFDATETNTEGIYDGEVEVTDSAGKIITFPTNGYFTLEVTVDLG